MFIQDSRRSYRTYTYTDLCLFRTPVGVTELILITDLYGFRTSIGVTELRLMVQSLILFEGTRRYHRDYGTYTGISEHILVLRNLYLYGLMFIQDSRRSYRTYTYNRLMWIQDSDRSYRT